jgi:hypothetical protein
MSLKDDVRALGVGAPLRAGYELSKRTVGHDLVFGKIVPRGTSPRRVRLLPVPQQVSATVAERTLAEARRISAGQVEVFGQPVEVGAVPDWHQAIHVDGSWSTERWWKVDIRSSERLGDIKWCWELARFRHVVVLARACWLAPQDRVFAEALERHVVSFLDQNPPERGVHWYSNLELSLRAFAWLQVLSLAEASLDPAVVDRIVDTLYRTGRHLVADLPYTVSTMRNNHLLGDAVGLCALGHAFADHRFGRRWTRIGDRLIARFLRSARRPQGTFIEDSVSYHRFVLELLAARVVLGGAAPEVSEALADGAQFLCRLGALVGPVPQYGDWDEGRALITAADPCGLAGSVLACLALAGGGAPPEWLEMHDEVAWYCRSGAPVEPQPAESGGAHVGGGVARVEYDSSVLWLKVPAGTSHQHADATSVSLLIGGVWLTGDPGTGTYNGPEEERNYFRGSVAHNVLRVDGIDQLEPHRAFRWKHRAGGGVVEPIRLDGAVLLAGWHTAYQRLDPPSTVLRVVLVASQAVVVADFVDRPSAGVLSIPLGPAAVLQGSAIELGGRELALRLPSDPTVQRGSSEPFCGWWSDTYGQRQPSTLLSSTVPARSPIVWALGDAGVITEAPDRFETRWGRVSVEWRSGGARVHVETPTIAVDREVVW